MSTHVVDALWWTREGSVRGKEQGDKGKYVVHEGRKRYKHYTRAPLYCAHPLGRVAVQRQKAKGRGEGGGEGGSKRYTPCT